MRKFGPCVATYETLRKAPGTLCKDPWRVYGLLIIFSASGFPVIIKFQPATWNLQPAKHTCRYLTISSRILGRIEKYRFRDRQREGSEVGEM